VRGPVAAEVEPAERHPARGVLIVLLIQVDHRHHGLSPAGHVHPSRDLAPFGHGVRAELDGEVGEGARHLGNEFFAGERAGDPVLQDAQGIDHPREAGRHRGLLRGDRLCLAQPGETYPVRIRPAGIRPAGFWPAGSPAAGSRFVRVGRALRAASAEVPPGRRATALDLAARS
jgi:hypothetical protein